MDSQIAFYKRIPALLIVAGIVVFGFLLVGPEVLSGHGKRRLGTPRLFNSWSPAQLTEVYGQAWLQIQSKINQMRHEERENYALRLKNAQLRADLEALQFECRAHKGASSTEEYEGKLVKDTGVKVGRSLASINYKPPAKLLPSQLYTLGVGYLKSNEDEKAAVILTSLTNLEETDTYRNSKDLLMTGVAWYRLDNPVLADSYFDQVLKQPEKPEFVQFQAQARLWKALVAKKLGKQIKAQYWLNDLIDRHPHSAEAEWVNF